MKTQFARWSTLFLMLIFYFSCSSQTQKKRVQGRAKPSRLKQNVTAKPLYKQPARMVNAKLSSKDPLTRYKTISKMGNEGGMNAKWVPRLLGLLSDPSSTVRAGAVRSLALIGKQVESIVPPMIKLLDDPAWPVRRRAAWALGTFGKKSQKALPALQKGLKDKNIHVVKASQQAIKLIESALSEKKPDEKQERLWIRERLKKARK